MRITADTGKCLGAGQCVLSDPERFDQSPETGTVVVLDTEVEDDAQAARLADIVALCPSQAITLEV